MDYWGPRYFRVGPFLCARPPPARPAWGEGRYMPKTPCLFAPADDRNGPATPTDRGSIGHVHIAP